MNKASFVFYAAIASVFALASCGSSASNRPSYDGVQFKTRAKAVDKKTTLALFEVEVPGVSRSINGARLAAHHAGISYCLTKAGYGTSKIDWDVDPLDPEVALVLDGDKAIFVGECDH